MTDTETKERYWVTPPECYSTIYSRETLEEAKEAAAGECKYHSEGSDPVAVVYKLEDDNNTLSPVTAFTCEGMSDVVKEVQVESWMILGKSLNDFQFVN